MQVPIALDIYQDLRLSGLHYSDFDRCVIFYLTVSVCVFQKYN